MSKDRYRGYRDLKVYQLAYELALEIQNITKTFPKEEKYSLVDQIRRSSRSVPTNLAEAWKKRRYEKAFELCPGLREECRELAEHEPGLFGET